MGLAGDVVTLGLIPGAALAIALGTALWWSLSVASELIKRMCGDH